MHLIIAQQIGRIHHAAGHPDLRKTRPVYAFIPEGFFDEGGFQKGRYLASRWPCINAGANPLAVGSHGIPDPEMPVEIRSRCQILAEFVRRLETLAAIKNQRAA